MQRAIALAREAGIRGDIPIGAVVVDAGLGFCHPAYEAGEEALVAAARANGIAMLVLIHLTGGAESPLIIFFVFHIIVASLLFERRVAAVYAAAPRIDLDRHGRDRTP